MDMYSRKDYLKEVQKEYLSVDKLDKSKLLDEAIKRTGLVRKYLIRRLSAKTRWERLPNYHQRRSKEYGIDLIVHLVELWDIFNEPCGQRLAPLIHDELERLRYFNEILVSNKQSEQLKKMSAKTIDRLLEHEKSVRIIEIKYAKKNNPLLYQMIPTKMSDEWDRTKTGQIQIDGVEHCGQSAKGEYLVTVPTIDIASHWWEAEAVMGKGQERTLAAINMSRQRFPFTWSEIHPDNGTSFINYFVYDYAKKTNLEFSRSRPYQKNDNCFIEQKNSQNVRKIFGYARYDTQKEQAVLNDLYRNGLRLYKNFFQPVMRLELKQRYKGHIYRKYQEAKTPYRWLMDSSDIAEDIKQKLKVIYESLNPAQLKRDINTKLKLLSEICHTKEHRLTKIDDIKVTFSFDPTTELRLPTLVT